MGDYEVNADLHSGFYNRWNRDANSWLERTLGRLAGTYEFTVNCAAFHRECAVNYTLLAQGHGLPGEAEKFESRVDRCMQHALYGESAVKGMITRVQKE
jgi:hypothetical protein